MRVKKLIYIGLCLLGGIEMFYGIVFGRIRIYAHECPFNRALSVDGPLSGKQVQALNHYLELFKDQWTVVAVFGVITIVLALYLLGSELKKG